MADKLEIVNEFGKLIGSNAKLYRKFSRNPKKVIGKLLKKNNYKIKLSNRQLGALVSGIKAKIQLDDIVSVADEVKNAASCAVGKSKKKAALFVAGLTTLPIILKFRKK